MRRPLSKVAYEAFLAVTLGAQLQNLLFPHEVERQGSTHHERDMFCRFVFKISRVVVKEKRVADLVESKELFFGAVVGTKRAIVQVIDVPFQELVLRVALRVDQFGDAKGRAANGDDV